MITHVSSTMADGAFKEKKKTKKKKNNGKRIKKIFTNEWCHPPRSVDDMRCVPGINI